VQLGTRWTVGGQPPTSLPDVVVQAVKDVESELESDGIDATSWRWTLTWLEGRPIVELDDGTRVEYNPVTDSATIRPADEDDLQV
jgi:hypothetical protein